MIKYESQWKMFQIKVNELDEVYISCHIPTYLSAPFKINIDLDYI
jgi:hypothetical protein